jgi:hypothetical protein
LVTVIAASIAELAPVRRSGGTTAGTAAFKAVSTSVSPTPYSPATTMMAHRGTTPSSAQTASAPKAVPRTMLPASSTTRRGKRSTNQPA